MAFKLPFSAVFLVSSFFCHSSSTRIASRSIKVLFGVCTFCAVLSAPLAIVSNILALTHAPLADVVALSFTQPLYVTLFAALFAGERIRWQRWIATLAGFCGVLLMLHPSGETINPWLILAMLSPCGIAISVLLVKRLTKTENMLTMLLWFGLVATVATSGPAYWVWQWPKGFDWALFSLVGILGIASQSMIIKAHCYAEASFVAPFDYTRILYATLLGVIVFGEEPDFFMICGAAIIIMSTLTIIRREAQLNIERDSSGEQIARKI